MFFFLMDLKQHLKIFYTCQSNKARHKAGHLNALEGMMVSRLDAFKTDSIEHPILPGAPLLTTESPIISAEVNRGFSAHTRWTRRQQYSIIAVAV